MNIFQSNSSINVNGIKINVPNGSNITINNGELYVNGKLYENEELKDKKIVKLIIEGDVGDVRSQVDVQCKNVNGNVNAGRDVDVSGNITGNVNAGRDIDCKKIGGKAMAGRDISY